MAVLAVPALSGSAEVMLAIAALLPDAYRGAYAERSVAKRGRA
jgi:hypothetical protein